MGVAQAVVGRRTLDKIVRRGVTIVMSNGEKMQLYVRSVGEFIEAYDYARGRTVIINPNAVAYIVINEIVD